MEKENKVQIGAILGGINVILIGLYLLLGMTGILLFSYLPALLKLWPIILIAIGLDIIFRSFNIKYVGSIVMTIFIILAIVASVPGATGTGVRKIFGMPEEPVGWNFDRIIKTWVNDSGMKVFETVEENKEITFMPTKFVVKPEGNVKNLYVSIKKGDTPSCKIKTEILDGIALFEVKEPDVIVAKESDKVYMINSFESKGKFCNIYIEAAFADTTEIVIDANLRKIEIADNWRGNVNLGSTTSCDVMTGNLGEFRIKSASGSIQVGDCKKVEIDTVSAEVKTGNLAESSKIYSASGDLETGIVNDIELKTISGNIAVAGVQSKSTFKTVSGDITANLQVGSKNLIAESTSGNINISNMQTVEKAVLKSISGNVKVTLAKEVNLSINADTLSGNIDIAGSEKTLEPGFDRSLVVGNGSGRLEIGTTSGNIEVK